LTLIIDVKRHVATRTAQIAKVRRHVVAPENCVVVVEAITRRPDNVAVIVDPNACCECVAGNPREHLDLALPPDDRAELI
jgi:hypothetical protein